MDPEARNKARQPIISGELKGGASIDIWSNFLRKLHGTFPILTLSGLNLACEVKPCR
jgi:hypothetical protein